jgi:hypothetical protein
LSRLILTLLAGRPLAAALTEAQRVADFQALANTYAKGYAPANWKLLAFGINIFDTAPWLQRVRAAKSDLEHVQILSEYAASFRDTHTQVSLTSNFLADLGFYCDLYDGEVRIDQINRALLPQGTYPFTTGDELVSIDGQPALTVARALERNIGWGNPRASLRYAIQGITFRPQSSYPLAVLLPESSRVVIRRASGELETYTIPWTKTGFPVRDLGSASALADAPLATTPASESEEPHWERPAWRRSSRPQLLARAPRNLQSLRGFGRQTPVWALPAGFLQRLGRGANDIFFSGTYLSDGLRIGLLRIRDFSFLSNAQLNQLASEINFMNNNTDGLVLDVMRNPGGYDCASVEAAAMLIPTNFRVGGASIRPSLSWLQYFDSLVLSAEFFSDPQYVIDTFTFQRDLVSSALASPGRPMTGAIPSCSLDTTEPSYSFAYRKPMILLVDDFSTSAADAFASYIQDNRRAKLVGTRTNGAGGNVTQVNAGPFSEVTTSFTQSLMVRNTTISANGFPDSPFVENVGIRPDVELDYMTLENLRLNGRPFVEAFTKKIVEEIRASR